jgi:hypothetical protein
MGIINAVRGSYGALRALSGLTKVINPFCRRFDRAENCAVRSRTALPPGPINGQALGELSKLPYGAWTMGNNGCELIAVYNALLTLRRPTPLPEIAAAMERRGLLFNGFGGTNISAVADYLRTRGVDVTILRRRQRAQFDEALKASDCAILAYWTGPTLRQPGGRWNMLHTVSVRPVADGVEVCNVLIDRPAPWHAASVAEFLEACDGDPVCLFALK